MATQGTWFGGQGLFQDRGITEGIAKFFGSQGSTQPTMFYNPAAAQTGQIGPAQYSRTTNQQPAGNVLGAVNNANGPVPTNTGGNPPPSGNPQPSAPSFEDQQRASINSGWDAYTNSLNEQLGNLSGQQEGQNLLANQTYTSGVNQLGTQQEAGIRDVNQQQASSLKDLGENVRNLFTAGNINLGSRGASDSSAANQYSYAIGKMGTKARGDILAQSNNRMNQLKDIYSTETNRLESEKNTRIAQISDWFNQAQSQIKGQIGQAGLNKQKDIQALSTNIYNQALQAMQGLEAETRSRRASLESWATTNAKNIGEVINNMKQIQQMPEFQGLQGGMPTVNSQGQPNMFGYGASQDNTKDIFGLKR